MSGIIDTDVLTQVGFIVKDIEETRKKFAAFFGVEVPPIVGGGNYDVTGTTVRG